MNGTAYPQKWCGQTQPHPAHVWASSQPPYLYQSCAGHS